MRRVIRDARDKPAPAAGPGPGSYEIHSPITQRMEKSSLRAELQCFGSTSTRGLNDPGMIYKQVRRPDKLPKLFGH